MATLPSSEPPLITASVSLEQMQARRRHELEVSARANEVTQLWQSASSSIMALTLRFGTEPPPNQRAQCEWGLHELWTLYYLAGKHCDENDVARLVVQLVELRRLGDIQHTAGSEVIGEAARAVDSMDQQLWRGMPLLVDDMTGHWVRDCASMGKKQRERLSGFLAHLVATGAADERLLGIALIALRDTLETKRQMAGSGDVNESTGREMASLAVEDLLLAVNAWLVVAGHQIIWICEDNGKEFPAEIGALGSLAREAGVEPAAGGFSVSRWFFWLTRLEEISNQQDPDDNPPIGSPELVRLAEQGALSVPALAKQVAYNMVSVAADQESSILRELKRRGKLPPT